MGGRRSRTADDGQAPVRTRLPDRVTVVEVGPRDGLQNEPTPLEAQAKIRFIEALSDAGLRVVEATSFVNPERVPQLADAAEVLETLKRRDGVRYPVLVPNLRGLERALEVGADEIAVFASATESFSQRNLGRSREEAIEMFRPVCEAAAEAGVRVRGYLSMVLGDPWEGNVSPAVVVDAGIRLLELGCVELSLGDTIGVGTPGAVQDLIEAFVDEGIPSRALAVHFHDTYGQGLANVLAALECDVTTVDTSAGGLGGCPFARSATGNLATEDLVWMLDGLGVETGVDLHATARAAADVCRLLGRPLPGRVARAVTDPSDET
ncbi:MAG TPA: hydroxymethylglutaryl-CoA lyase [Actinomycetota bacterium]|nr:hydroxymethylglutaryl-CoA lyase [Actinomycetota bacterium]